MITAASLIFFEDRQVSNFYPLTLSHTVAGLRCGIFTLAEKWCVRFAATDSHYLTRPELRNYLRENCGQDCDLDSLRSPHLILVNPRFLPDPHLLDQLQSCESQIALVAGDDIVAVCLDAGGAEAKRLHASFKSSEFGNVYVEIEAIARAIDRVEVENKPLCYLWDLVHRNGEEIARDFDFLRRTRKSSQQAVPDPNCQIYNWDSIFISPGARIDGQVVLDARGGPIYIGPDAVIVAQTRVEGPAMIGARTQLVGGNIREGCTFGPECRVGGEVEESIFQGYSNKYHDGFIGHAYLGEWVNLGAMTTNSDLKNNYGPVKVELPSALLNSGQSKVGSFIGDHVKTGIGTLLTTGMVVGYGTNIFGGGLAGQRFLPGFLWGGATGFVEYELDKAIATAAAVLPRRARELTDSARQLFWHIFEAERELRARFLG